MLGSILAALLLGHGIGDYWIQTPWQANTKARPGWIGRYACAAHVVTYTATLAAAVLAVVLTQHPPLDGGRLVAGLTISAVSHYVADRRTPLRRIALAAGKDPAWLDGGGLALLDQAWHGGWLLVCALVAV